MLRKLPISLFSAAAAFAVAVAGTPAQAVTLKVSSCLAKNHDYTEAFLDTFYNSVNAAKTDLTLRYIGGPEVTPRQKQAPALKRGLIDIITCPAAYYGGILSEARLPGMQNKSLEEMRANGAMDMLQTAWNKGLNAQILAWVHFNGQIFFMYTRFKPKTSTETGLDLTGFKMRSTGLYNALFKAMHATPVNISPGDVYSALERGVVAGLAWPWGSIAKYGWQRFLKYRIEPGFYGATLMTIINLDKWNSLTKAQKDLLEKQARNYESKADAIIVAKGKVDDAKLKKAGITIIKLTGAVGKAYIKTIYGAKWAQNDKQKYIVDYKKLKAKMYTKPGS